MSRTYVSLENIYDRNCLATPVTQWGRLRAPVVSPFINTYDLIIVYFFVLFPVH
jgi:hypothetical protein